MTQNDNINFLIKEYEKLKDEQYKRIEFRDHMIYLTLGAIGTIFSFSLEKPNFNIALLVLPFICIVLGWSYLSNDEKITSIGNYIKNVLIPKIDASPEDNLLSLKENWENFIKKDPKRISRKRFQLFVDLSIYCISGIVSIIAFYILHTQFSIFMYIISILEIILLTYLAIQFVRYSDIK